MEPFKLLPGYVPIVLIVIVFIFFVLVISMGVGIHNNKDNEVQN